MKIRVGTRGSRLALTQTQGVVDAMVAYHPDLEVGIVVIKTTGDKFQEISLEEIGEKGLFVKEIERALLDGDIDVAVHSLKDMPGDVTEGLRFAPEFTREDPRDVLLMREPFGGLHDIPKGAVIGTGSKRRSYQLLKLRPDLNPKDIRGNVDTRIEKMLRGDYDGIIVAQAGLNRLGIQYPNAYVFSEQEMIPAPGQGILAIQIREEDEALLKTLRPLYCENTCHEALAERAFLKGIGGSCHIPIGAKATIEGDQLSLTGLYGDEAGETLIRMTLAGPLEKAEAIGYELAERVVKAYGRVR